MVCYFLEEVNHLGNTAIEEYLFGQMSGNTLEQTEKHFRECRICQDRAADFGQLVGGFPPAGRATHEDLAG